MARGYVLFNINRRCTSWVIFFLPPLALTFCVVYHLAKDFEKATWTHCRVANLLPSLSMAIGDSAPEKYVWQFVACVTTAPRMVFAYMVYRHLCQKPATYKKYFNYTAKFALWCEWIELNALLLLSLITSNDNFLWHEISFIIFLLTSILLMISNLILHIWKRNDCLEVVPYQSNWNFDRKRYFFYRATTSYSLLPLTNGDSMNVINFQAIDEDDSRLRVYLTEKYERKVIKFKIQVVTMYIAFFITSMYFYQTHMTKCHPYFYTLFALCEYVVIYTNIFYHGYNLYVSDGIPFNHITFSRPFSRSFSCR